MIFVFNKNKIISYIIASSVVICLFAFSISVIPNKDVELIQVSSNATNIIEDNKLENNNFEKDNTYN